MPGASTSAATEKRSRLLVRRRALVAATAAALLAPCALGASAAIDKSRLGTEYTLLPIVRTGGGVNVLSLGVGTPAQTVNLTVSPNVNYVAIGTSACDNCFQQTWGFYEDSSSTVSKTGQGVAYTSNYPGGDQDDTLTVTGEFIKDVLSTSTFAGSTWPMVAVANVSDGDATEQFSAGTQGFFGLGVDQVQKTQSILPATLLARNDGSMYNTNFTLGFDLVPFNSDATTDAGKVHWGGVRTGSYTGLFNWVDADPYNGWRFGIDNVKLGTVGVSTSSNFATIDPGYDPIYVPLTMAEELFAGVTDAARDVTYTDRWNVPCDAELNLVVRIGGQDYNVNSTTLVAQRDRSGRTCWANIVSWDAGSVPEQTGEIRLGAAFISSLYAAMFYSNSTSYIGFAGKPGTANGANVGSVGKPNPVVVGAVLGTILPLLVIGLVLCFLCRRLHPYGFGFDSEARWARMLSWRNRAADDAAMAVAVGEAPPPYPVPPAIPGMPTIPPAGVPLVPNPTGFVPPHQHVNGPPPHMHPYGAPLAPMGTGFVPGPMGGMGLAAQPTGMGYVPPIMAQHTGMGMGMGMGGMGPYAPGVGMVPQATGAGFVPVPGESGHMHPVGLAPQPTGGWRY